MFGMQYVLKLEGTYHPRINPGSNSGPSSVERRLEGKYASVCEYLYDQRHVIKQKKEAAQRKALQEIEEQANMRYTKELSSKLVHEMKARAYEHIFRCDASYCPFSLSCGATWTSTRLSSWPGFRFERAYSSHS